MDPHLPAPPLGSDQQNLRFRARRSPCLQETTPADAAHWSGSTKRSLPRPAVALLAGNHTCRRRPLVWISKTFASASAGRLACRKPQLPAPPIRLDQQNLRFRVRRSPCVQETTPAGLAHWPGSAKPSLPRPPVALPLGNHTCRPRPSARIIKTFASASAGRLACRKTHRPVLWVWISKLKWRRQSVDDNSRTTGVATCLVRLSACLRVRVCHCACCGY